jgi:hypothetical protein
MSQALDYSSGFPGAANIKRAGYVGAVRYVGFPDRRKCTNRAEFSDFHSNGLGMATVFERDAADWRGGFGAGQVSARQARDHTNAIGFPADRPIYMAIDQDVVSTGEFDTMIEYLRGANASLGGSALTGVYGEADVIDRARDAGVAHWFWQTAAWSRSRVAKDLHIFQHVGAVNVGGVGCDINEVLQEDWGQHSYQGDDDMAMTQQQFNEMLDAYYDSKTDTVFGETLNMRTVGFKAAQWAGESFNAVKAITGQLSAVELKLLSAVASEKPVIELDPEEIEALLGGFTAATKKAMREVLGSLDNPTP